MILSTSYFINDLISCNVFGLANSGLYFHHAFAISGYLSGLIATRGAADGIYGIFYAEISNLPMHLRVILKNYGLRYTRAYELMEIIYLVTYSISRGIFVPIYLVYPCLLSQNSPIMVKVICLGLFFQSVFYIKEMMGIMRRKEK